MTVDADMNTALHTFIVESTELLDEMERGLLELETIEEPEETVNAIFRTVHTIKGSAGLFGFEHIVGFTHIVESVLDSLREGQLLISADLVAALLPCCDHINSMIHDIATGKLDENPELRETGEQLLLKLWPFLKTEKKTGVTEVKNNTERLENKAIDAGHWHIFLQFGENCLRDGMDPLAFIRYLKTLGEILDLTTHSHALPDAQLMNPETNYLSFEIILKSDENKKTLEDVFEFVRESSHIHILPLENRIPYYVKLIESLAEEEEQLGELLLKSGVITQRELEEGLKIQQAHSENQQATTPLGEILVDQQTVQRSLVNAALKKQKQIKESKSLENQSIRVDTTRLDKLIDLIGELVISSSAANIKALQAGNREVQEANAAIISLVEEVRDSALQLRMVPISSTFNRFQRIVRDVSKELGKDIRLVISGAETEIDKSIVDKIGDPLLHLVRNTIDHGIEHAELRAARKKPIQGTLHLNAYHSSGSIVIEVSDDGSGLDRNKIYAKAVERGLIKSGAILTEQEIFALIFEPGFSTAERISNLSGRGVGMDVVKRNIAEMRGAIHIDSKAGEGTTIRITLPLTLAIIDGFMVDVSDATYVIPLDSVIECVESPIDEIRTYMELRGEVLPLVYLQQLLRKKTSKNRRQNVVVVEHAGTKIGLVVDNLLGELQTVVKPLGKLFSHVRGIGGSTIMGNGQIALIIDVPSLLNYCEHLQRTAYALDDETSRLEQF